MLFLTTEVERETKRQHSFSKSNQNQTKESASPFQTNHKHKVVKRLQRTHIGQVKTECPIKVPDSILL